MSSEGLNQVILVDRNDQVTGQMEKLEAHKKGELHRAFSILLFNDSGELLLQQRALDKYHSGGLWTNTCCSHPQPNETTEDAANRRLEEEMGISAKLDFAFKFIYKTKLDQGLIEHELDHVFIGKFSRKPKINSEEVNDWKWVSLKELHNDIQTNPNDYTIWFKNIVQNQKMREILQDFYQ